MAAGAHRRRFEVPPLIATERQPRPRDRERRAAQRGRVGRQADGHRRAARRDRSVADGARRAAGDHAAARRSRQSRRRWRRCRHDAAAELGAEMAAAAPARSRRPAPPGTIPTPAPGALPRCEHDGRVRPTLLRKLPGGCRVQMRRCSAGRCRRVRWSRRRCSRPQRSAARARRSSIGGSRAARRRRGDRGVRVGIGRGSSAARQAAPRSSRPEPARTPMRQRAESPSSNARDRRRRRRRCAAGADCASSTSRPRRPAPTSGSTTTQLGITPATIELPCGVEAKLRVKKARLATMVRAVMPGTDTNVSVRARRARRFDDLDARQSNPPGATITVGRQASSASRRRDPPARARGAAMTLTKEGYTPDTEHVSPRPNATTTSRSNADAQRLPLIRRAGDRRAARARGHEPRAPDRLSVAIRRIALDVVRVRAKLHDLVVTEQVRDRIAVREIADERGVGGDLRVGERLASLRRRRSRSRSRCGRARCSGAHSASRAAADRSCRRDRRESATTRSPRPLARAAARAASIRGLIEVRAGRRRRAAAGVVQDDHARRDREIGASGSLWRRR